MHKQDRLKNLMGQGLSTLEMANRLETTKTWIIKAMHRLAKLMPVSAFCATVNICKRTCRHFDGVLISDSLWYCIHCYKRWEHIDHSKVSYFTIAGVEGSEERCAAALKKLRNVQPTSQIHDEQAFFNKSLGVPFVDNNPPVCAICQELWGGPGRPGATTKGGNWICHNCIHNRDTNTMTQHERQQAFEALGRSNIKTIKPRSTSRMITDQVSGIHPSYDKLMTRKVRMTPTEFADLKDRVAKDAFQFGEPGIINYNDIREHGGEITLEKGGKCNLREMKIEASAKKLSGIVDFFESPKGWDIIMYYKRQAFLRHDGIVVHRINSISSQWYIYTKHELMEVNHGFESHLEAIAAADEHIPMGELI